MATNNATNNSSTLALIQAQDVTSVTSVTFTTGITTAYNNFLLLSNNLSLSATATVQLLQLSTDGGSTYINTGYLTSGPLSGFTTAGLIVNAAVTGSSATGSLNSGTTLYNMTLNQGYIACVAEIVGYDPSGSVLGGATSQSAYTVVSTVTNAFQLVSDDGTAFSGQFILYGYLS